MSLASFKQRIAKRYETTADNVVVNINDKIYGNADLEATLMLEGDLGIDQYKTVKISFLKAPPPTVS